MNYYTRDGIPTDMTEWSRDYANKRVARTKIADAADPSREVDVSTVYLGIDHSFGAGPPLIFESMAFAKHDPEEERCERYSTEQEAREGHTRMVVEVSAEMADPIVIDVED